MWIGRSVLWVNGCGLRVNGSRSGSNILLCVLEMGRVSLTGLLRISNAHLVLWGIRSSALLGLGRVRDGGHDFFVAVNLRADGHQLMDKGEGVNYMYMYLF